ncbi:hypothetical protein CSA56_06280 [candidate division KSB3 bacterium]|uniref:ABC-2 type transporter domain-containing protein n=1 Tax=candidate division KSB3 bacterium TaxID=2044937 RepID=A0A2G6KGY0_9BACT|nr:MAG: hypothetical protein CSA56_06280 [candidate division KSB3 bacterium]
MQRALNSTITVYRPNQRHELGFFQTWIVMARNVIRSKELIWQLFKRDLLAGYKKSFLGMTWIFVSPIMAIISWVFLQKTGMLNPGDVGIPYPAYVLLGSSMWGLFMGFYTAARGTLKAGAGFIMQVNYPHEALLFKQMAQQLAQPGPRHGHGIIAVYDPDHLFRRHPKPRRSNADPLESFDLSGLFRPRYYHLRKTLWANGIYNLHRGFVCIVFDLLATVLCLRAPAY